MKKVIKPAGIANKKPSALVKKVSKVPSENRGVTLGSVPMSQPKRVTIERASNGFIVSKGYGEGQHIAPSIEHAHKLSKKLLK